MDIELRVSPSAKQLISRLSVPAAGTELESAAPQILGSSERLEAARNVLKRLAKGTPDVDEAVIDQLIQDAEEALHKLNGDGESAELSESEAFGIEAVIEVDGSRPVLFVQDGTIKIDAPELSDSLAVKWQGAAMSFITQIRKVVASVGGVQRPAFGNQRIGTAFAIAPSLVVTNRHVLEEIAEFVDEKWQWKFDAEVDFFGEHERSAENKFQLEEVVLTGANPINHIINFANLDFAIIRVKGNEAKFPDPLSLERELERVKVHDDQHPAIYTVGFPGKPWIAPGKPADGAPKAGHEYQEVLEKLYQNRFGTKRWAPGLVEAGAGQLAGDAKKWVMSHDASTLGGSSGSCVVDFANNGERVVGLHFGGRPRVQNYAHVAAALQEHLKSIESVVWI
jgi:hypothetical protein